MNNLCFAFLSINSIRHKLSCRFNIVGHKLDIFAIAETKIDETFSENQFNVVGFRNPYRLDKTVNSGGILIYVKHGIFSDIILKHEEIQLIAIDIRLSKERWAFVCIYRPPSQNLTFFLDKLSEVLDKICSSYDNIIIVGDFNINSTENVKFS